MKLKQYIYSQLSLSFFPIFFGLFFITSIIFLVRIAALTSIITMNVTELFTLYLYSVPNILFYTLPIAFFIGLVISLAKLSSEYELIVITSFGLNPIQILKICFPITFLLGISLLIISLALIPKAKYLTEKMMDEKKREANFNVKSSEYGQKFGEWMIYIEDKKDNYYADVKLFKIQNNSDQFIVSKTATIQNNNGNLNILLNDGKLFDFKEKEMTQINFQTMSISEEIRANPFWNPYTTPIAYWKFKFKWNLNIDNFVASILISLFPLFSLFLVIAFGYFNPRYDKNRSIALSVLVIVIYFLCVDFLSKKILFNTLYFFPLLWIGVSYYVYYRKVKKAY